MHALDLNLCIKLIRQAERRALWRKTFGRRLIYTQLYTFVVIFGCVACIVRSRQNQGSQLGFVNKYEQTTSKESSSITSGFFHSAKNNLTQYSIVPSERIIEFEGRYKDHISMYKPLCIETTSGTLINFVGEHICTGYNRTNDWLSRHCGSVRNSSLKEQAFIFQSRQSSWLSDFSADIKWVDGYALIQKLPTACGNIAHFASRVLFLHHILENREKYFLQSPESLHILVVTNTLLMDRFTSPKAFSSYHEQFLRSAVYPIEIKVSTFSKYLSSLPKISQSSNAFVFSDLKVNEKTEHSNYVCFRRAITPGFLKGRFFLSDFEYNFFGTEHNLRTGAMKADTPTVPKDSARFRKKVEVATSKSIKNISLAPSVLLLDRTGKKRLFDAVTRSQVLATVKEVAGESGYTFNVADFSAMTFLDQYHSMSSVSIAIGIHGANLVNAIFMPPYSVLIEIFPYGFQHDMYYEGGNSGLKYFSYTLTNGSDFMYVKRYRSTRECRLKNKRCKLHYRDAMLSATQQDILNLKTVLQQAISWRKLNSDLYT